jgi:Flp pilus assembly pilin Flp
MKVVKRLWNEETGQDLVEYALIVAVVALGVVGAMTYLKSAINTTFSSAAANLATS